MTVGVFLENERFFRREEVEVDEEAVEGVERELVELLVGVVVEEGVACAFEVYELALVAFATVVLGELGNVVKGGNSVVTAVKKKARREVFGWKKGARAIEFGLLGGREAFVFDSLGSGVDDG